MCIGFTMVKAGGRQKSDTTLLHLNNKLNKKDKNYLKTSLRVSLPATKSYVIPASRNNTTLFDEKILSGVQVYPNPVTDKININYSLSRNANVNIKLMDVLGNEVAVLFSQRVEPGKWNYATNLGNKYQSGFYFVRVIVGTESVIKRISIL